MGGWGRVRRIAALAARPILCVVFVASLIYAPTRELQVQCARLMLRFLPLGGNTDIKGPGETDMMLDGAYALFFTQTFRDKVRDAASQSADGFILALAIERYRPFDSPPLERLEGHPLLPWMAISFAEYAARPLESWGKHDGQPPSPEKALALLHLAQATHPNNGALWLAEAAVELEAGWAEAGLQALKLAARKRSWDAQPRAAFLHQRRLLEASGLPRLDASRRADRMPYAAAWAVYVIREHFTKEMEKAVAERNDVRFADLLSLLAELGKPAWRNGQLPNAFCCDPLSYATERPRGTMLDRLKKDAPAAWDEDQAPLATPEQGRAIFRLYVSKYASLQVAAAFLEREGTACEENRKFVEEDRARGWFDVEGYLARAAGGFLTCLLQPLAVIALILPLPFWLAKGREATPPATPRNVGFWVAAALAVAVGTGLLTSAWIAGISARECFIGRVWDSLLWSSVLCAGWFAYLVAGPRRKARYRLMPRSAVVLGFLYLAAVAVTAYFRYELVAAIESALP